MDYRRWIFEPVADDFSFFEAKGSYRLVDDKPRHVKDNMLMNAKASNSGNENHMNDYLGEEHREPHRSRQHSGEGDEMYNDRMLEEEKKNETETEEDKKTDNVVVEEEVPLEDQEKHWHIFVASQAASSFLRRYYDEEKMYVFPHLTAIIEVQRGVVIGITWDSACMFCHPIRCRKNTYNFRGAVVKDLGGLPINGCFVRRKECEELSLQGNHKGKQKKDKAKGGNDKKDQAEECQLKIYFAWTGTDVNGNALSSVNKRFSAFNNVPKMGLPSLEDVGEVVTDVKNDIKDNIKDQINATAEGIKDGLNDAATGIKDGIKNKLNETAEGIKDGIKDSITGDGDENEEKG